MADARPQLPYSFPARAGRCLALAAAFLSAVAARGHDVPDSFGSPSLPDVTLAVPMMPTIIDDKGRLVVAMANWLSLVAEKAGVHMKVQGANFDRRTADMARYPDHCVLGYARLPAREANARWLAEVRRDRVVFVARPDDPFKGGLDAFLKLADNDVAAPSGIYREVLAARGVTFLPVDDQRSLARMVQAGRVRFAMMVGGTLNAPEVRAMRLRVVAELPPQQFWFACSPGMSDAIALPLAAALQTEEAEILRRKAMNEPAIPSHPPTN